MKRCRSSKEAANRLSRPTLRSPWIAAINAYNPSIDYNNRVADAANHYATLRQSEGRRMTGNAIILY